MKKEVEDFFERLFKRDIGPHTLTKCFYYALGKYSGKLEINENDEVELTAKFKIRYHELVEI